MYHKHHIIPKYMGGSNDSSNIIKLTIEEHAETHRILWEKHGNWQDYLAWQGLSKRILSENVAREAARFANTGKILSDETKEKMRLSKLGKKHTESHIKNNSIAQKGKILSKTHREKISSSLSGRTLSEQHKKNVSKKLKGRVMNEEWKRKLSEAAKRRYAKNRKLK